MPAPSCARAPRSPPSAAARSSWRAARRSARATSWWPQAPGPASWPARGPPAQGPDPAPARSRGPRPPGARRALGGRLPRPARRPAATSSARRWRTRASTRPSPPAASGSCCATRPSSCPASSSSSWRRRSPGCGPTTPDNTPLIGRSERTGLVFATGHHRNGVLLASITGDLVADALAGAAARGRPRAGPLRRARGGRVITVNGTEARAARRRAHRGRARRARRRAGPPRRRDRDRRRGRAAHGMGHDEPRGGRPRRGRPGDPGRLRP